MTIGCRSVLALLSLAALATAQGVVAKSGAMVFHGSTSNCTKPATINLEKVEKATPEYKTIKADGVRRGSARYEILAAKMHKRIKEACETVADAEGHDCVLRKGDVKDSRGLHVADITKNVVDEIESDTIAA